MPAIVRHLPSTNSMARIRPAYVTETDTSPNRPRKAKCIWNDVGKYNAKPENDINRKVNSLIIEKEI